jgi:hypothetical protein
MSYQPPHVNNRVFFEDIGVVVHVMAYYVLLDAERNRIARNAVAKLKKKDFPKKGKTLTITTHYLRAPPQGL